MSLLLLAAVAAASEPDTDRARSLWPTPSERQELLVSSEDYYRNSIHLTGLAGVGCAIGASFLVGGPTGLDTVAEGAVTFVAALGGATLCSARRGAVRAGLSLGDTIGSSAKGTLLGYGAGLAVFVGGGYVALSTASVGLGAAAGGAAFFTASYIHGATILRPLRTEWAVAPAVTADTTGLVLSRRF